MKGLVSTIDIRPQVGKVRLFGHPDIEAVVNAALNREAKENIIDGALGYIQTKRRAAFTYRTVFTNAASPESALLP